MIEIGLSISSIHRILFLGPPEGTIWNLSCVVGRLGYWKRWKFRVGSPGIISRHSIILPGTKFLTLENLTGGLLVSLIEVCYEICLQA